MSELESGERSSVLDRVSLLKGRYGSLSGADRALGLWAVCCGLLAISSFRWPRVHDASIFEYAAWNFRRGAVPYRDLFDVNMPGTYLLHWGGQALLGEGDLHIRFMDLGFLALIGVALRHILRPLDPRVWLFAILAIVTVHLAFGGPNEALERDWVVAALVISAVALLVGGRLRIIATVLAGLILGFAVTIKPPALLALASVPLIVLIDGGYWPRAHRDERAGVLRRAAVTTVIAGVGASVVVAAVLVWVARVGDWSRFRWILSEYIPIYSKLDGSGYEQGSTASALLKTLGRLTFRFGAPIMLVSIIGFVGILRRRTIDDRQRRLNILALTYFVGVVYAVAQFKLFRYHMAVAIVPGMAMFAALLFRPLESMSSSSSAEVSAPSGLRRAVVGWRGWAAVGGPLLMSLSVVVVLVLLPSEGSIFAKELHDRSVKVAGVLHERAQPGDRVQVLDFTGGGLDASQRAGLRQATRFIYDVHFFHDQNSPVIHTIRGWFIDDFDRSKPQFVVVYRSSWGRRKTYSDLAQFPQLVDRLKPYREIWSDDKVTVLDRDESAHFDITRK